MIVLTSSSCNNSNNSNGIVPSLVDGDIVAVMYVSSQYYAIIYTCSWVSFFVSLFVLFLRRTWTYYSLCRPVVFYCFFFILFYIILFLTNDRDTWSFLFFLRFIEFFLLAQAARIRNNDTATVRFDVARSFSFSSRSKISFVGPSFVRPCMRSTWYIPCVSLRSCVLTEDQLSWSRQSSQLSRAMNVSYGRRESKRCWDDLVKIPTYLIRCIF